MKVENISGMISVMKYCAKCRTLKPESEFHVNRAMNDGLHRTCKPCTYDPVTPKRIQAIRDAGIKLCPKCGETKLFSEFHKDNSRILGLTSWCKFCDNDYQSDVRWAKKTDAQKARSREIAWRKDKKLRGLCTRCGKNPTDSPSSCMECNRKRNRDAKERRERWRAEGRCWQCGSTELIDGRARCSTCRQRELEKQTRIKGALRNEVIEFLGSKCACCNESIHRFLQLDHINGWQHDADAMKPSALRDILAGRRTDIRVLCINCNFGRELNGGTCPHEEQRKLLTPVVVDSSIPFYYEEDRAVASTDGNSGGQKSGVRSHEMQQPEQPA